MAKQTVKWHEECLKNFEASTQRQMKLAAKEIRLADLMQMEVLYCKKQIEIAKKKKMDSFDKDKFLKEEAPKVRYWQAHTLY